MPERRCRLKSAIQRGPADLSRQWHPLHQLGLLGPAVRLRLWHRLGLLGPAVRLRLWHRLHQLRPAVLLHL